MYRASLGRSELGGVWIYEALGALGGSYPVVFYFAQTYPARTFAFFLHLTGLFPWLYFVLLGLEVTSLHLARRPAWYVAALQGCRFTIASTALVSSILWFRSSLELYDERGLVARMSMSSLQDLMVFVLWWLASYHGFVTVVGTWVFSRRNASRAETIAQFDFRSTLALLPVHLARWTLMDIVKPHSRLQLRVLAYLGWPLRALSGSLGVFLCLSTYSRLPGEPRTRVLSMYGWQYLGGDLNSDPETSDYPRVLRAEGSTSSPDTPGYALSSLDGPELMRSLNPLRNQSRQGTERAARSPSASSSLERRATDDIPARRLRPRYLCIVDQLAEDGYRVEATDGRHDLDSVQYVFVSYTRMHFRTDLPGDPSSSVTPSEHTQNPATRRLISMAIDATNRAGVEAFWIDFECLKSDQADGPEASRSIGDVYQICDIVRGSYCMIIAVGPPSDARYDSDTYDHSLPSRRAWLWQYGDRLWTLPEVLLSPSNHGILLYFATHDGFESEQTEKRNLAERIWFDAETTRGLLEHYERSLTLSQIDMISLALECLQRRQTVTRYPADVIYALMGLLRERVAVREDQSAFEAFAHLSLANDSQKPLERLFCMRNKDQSKDWHDMNDLWGANIRDIEPRCEVIEVTADDTVQIANICGAAINWAPLPAIEFELEYPSNGAWRWRLQRSQTTCICGILLTIWLCALTHLILLGVIGGRSSREVKPVLNDQLLFIVMFAAISFISGCVFLPWSVHRLYGGKIKDVQARFLGIHGVADLGAIEEILFGRDCGRIVWSRLNADGSPPNTVEHNSGMTFTLVDTWSMTATAFQTTTRPSIVVVPGKHRGALRAMLCSYDDATRVYHREKVLRMDEQVLKRMPRMEPARFSLLPMPVFHDDLTAFGSENAAEDADET